MTMIRQNQRITEYMSVGEVASLLDVHKYDVGSLLAAHVPHMLEYHGTLFNGRTNYHVGKYDHIIYGDFVDDYLACKFCAEERAKLNGTRKRN